jgi:DNA-binding phage protein
METRDEIFIELIHYLYRLNDSDLKDLAAEANVHWVTLYSWKSGRTQRPRLDTVMRVARAAKFRISFKPPGRAR